jgi:hypothetical protein
MLREELGRQDLSIRKLSQRMNPNSPEIARRSLAKWIAGTTNPTPASRVVVADALGLPPDAFKDSDDGEDP